ncbi:MAG: response regulator [Shimia sp.]
MDDDLDYMPDFMPVPKPTAERPLLGLTVLVVEDSRYACEAIRLICLRSGARVRRAGTIEAAGRHLRVYRPSVVVVDVGLPDGSGVDLLAQLAEASPRAPVLLGMSGDGDMAAPVVDAGADAFLPKPVDSIATFQQAVLDHLPDDQRPSGLRVVTAEDVLPDTLTYTDDLLHAAEVLRTPGQTGDYAPRFLAGLATYMGDEELRLAAMATVADASTLPHLSRLLEQRVAAGRAA